MGNKPSSVALSGHTSTVHDCCVSEDGRLVLSAGGDTTVRVWDLPSLSVVRQFSGHGVPVYCCALSLDSCVAISGDMDGVIKVWRVANGVELGKLENHADPILSVCFSHDGCRALSASADKTIVHWDVTVNESGYVGGIKMHVLAGHKGAVNCAVFSPDGVMAISAASDNTIKLWNLKTGKEMRTMFGHTDAVLSCDVSPDGVYALSCSQDSTVRVWTVATGKEVRTLSGHCDAVKSCCFSRDGAMILSGSYDRKCIVWVRVQGADSWTRALTIKNHQRGVTSCAFTPDGMVAVTASWDKTLILSSVGDARLFAEFPPSSSSLQALIDDDGFKSQHPAMHAVVVDVDAMVGCIKVKARFNYLCNFYMRYGKDLGFPNVHGNMLIYGQQGTGKTHLSRLLARFLHAAKIPPHGSVGSVSSLLGGSDQVGADGPERQSQQTDDQGPLIMLRASKFKGATHEQTGANCRAFLEKHRGQVVLVREVDLLPGGTEGDHCAMVVRTIQQFLNEHPCSLTLIIVGNSRNDVGKIFTSYVPSIPEAVRDHFPFRFELERFTPEELLAIFRRQCAAEQLRFGGSLTDVMLEKTFALNARFLEGSNGTGTKQLLKVARLEHSKRQDKREGVLESTDMQSAFQKLRQDWFEINPDQTFTVLQQMQAEEKVKTIRKSIQEDDGAAEDANLALEGLDDSSGEDDQGSDDGFTLEDYRMFHDKEMKRREEEHREKMQRERDECKLVVEQTKRAHTLTVNRMRAAGLSMAMVKWRLRCVVLSLQRWKEAAASLWHLRHASENVVTKFRRCQMEAILREWGRFSGFSRIFRHRSKSLRNSFRNRIMRDSFDSWSNLRSNLIRLRLQKVALSLQLMSARDSAWILRNAFEDWSSFTEEELLLTSRQLEASQKEKEHADALTMVSKRHQSEMTELHLEYQERVRSQKAKRRTAESSLEPVKKWQSNAILAATALVVAYAAPTFPAVAPYVVKTFKQLSFGHWYVAILVLVSLYSALRRLTSWLWSSVLPLQVKSSFRWFWDTGFDSALVSAGIAMGSWQFACASPPAQRGVGPFTCTSVGECQTTQCLQDEDLNGYSTCAGRVEYLAKVVVATAGFVVAQKFKELGMQVHKRGVAGFVRAKIVSMVPSWFYSLHDQNSAETIAMVKDETVPLGKKSQACKRLADLANSSEGMVSVVVEGGGLQVLVELLIAVSSQENDLATSGAKALRSLLTSDQNICLAVEKGAVTALVKLLMRSHSSGIIEETLITLGVIGRSSDAAADTIVGAEGLTSRLCSLLLSRESSTRRQASLLMEKLTRDMDHAPLVVQGSPSPSSVLERRKALASCIEPLVYELKRGSSWLVLMCVQPENKGLAARALGNLAAGCWDNMEDMMRAGVVHALMQILRMKCLWAGTSSRLLALKGDASFAVASIAKGGDLPRGRLQEAGAIAALEKIWTAQLHNVDGKEAVNMREEARLALKAVRGNVGVPAAKASSSSVGSASPARNS